MGPRQIIFKLDLYNEIICKFQKIGSKILRIISRGLPSEKYPYHTLFFSDLIVF